MMDSLKDSQDALQKSAQKIQNIVNACPMGIHLYELDDKGDLRLIGFNPIANKILGIDHSFLLGKTMMEAFPGLRQMQHIIEKCKQAACEGKIYQDEIDYHDGSIAGIFEVLSFQTEPGQMATFFQEVTEKRRMEHELKEKEVALRFLSENLADGMVYQINSGVDGKDRRFTYLSPAVERLHGLKVEEVVKNPLLVYHQILENDRALLQEKEDYCFKTRTSLHADIRFLLPGGEIRWRRFISSPRIQADGSIVWDGIELDITQSKESEMELAAEKERLSVTLKSIGDGVITTDIHGCVVMMNPIAEKLTGWTQNEASGKPLSSIFFIISEVTGEPIRNPVEKVLSHKKIIELENNTILLSKDGRSHIIADSAAPILDQKGSILGVVLVFRDITEKQRLLKEAQKTQKLEYLGLFAGGIAHDFNNLLGGIFGCIDLACGISEDKKVCEYLDSAMQTIQRARSLTHQLLTFAKGGTPVCKIEPLFPFVKDTANFVLSGSAVLCHFEVEPSLWMCNYDKSQIAQVVENIILNAKQVMPEKGIITISAKNIHLQENEMESLRKGKYVKISIADTGPGIPANILPRIFDPFFTTKNQGNGLGLTICYSIINRHGGLMHVESEVGKGSIFHIFLPAYDKFFSSSKASDEKLKMKKHKGTGKILLMDDDPMIRKALGGMLARLGYAVVCTENGHETMQALYQAQEEGNSFIAIILDLTVPGSMGGKETVIEIRKLNKNIAIFASSGYAQDPVIANPKEYGFTASICKPFKTSELAEMLEQNLNNTTEQRRGIL